MGILSGLKQFGVDIDEDIYGDNKTKNSAESNAKAAAAAAEAEAVKKAAEERKKKNEEEPTYLLAKSYTCPVCDKTFKSLAVKANRARVVGHDLDLRPQYEPVDALKYNVLSCPYCGYSAFARIFPNITRRQKQAVLQKIAGNFRADGSANDKTVYTYEEALGRFQMAFATSMAVVAKSSEKAYLCLNMSWLVRGQRKSLVNDPEKLKECRETENELAKKALEGFVYARQTEDYPMCGNMDQYTVDYIIAALYYKAGEFDDAMRLLPDIVISNSASRGIKERARILKDKITEMKKTNTIPDED